MKLLVRNGTIEVGSLFKFVFVGVLIGEGIIFGIPFALIFLTIAASGFPAMEGGQAFPAFLLPLMLPLIITMHALMFGGMIVLGLWIYSRFGKLEVDAI
jgi:hypothetical protein